MTASPAPQHAASDSQLRRGLGALELVSKAPRTAATVARDLGVNRSTALRLLQELEDMRYVVRDPLTKRYTASVRRFYNLIVDHRDHSDWSEHLDPILAALSAETGEAAVLGVPANGAMVYMAYVPSSHIVSVRERIGTVRPMHSSALGKAYLSALDMRLLDIELGQLDYTDGTARAPRGPLELRHQVEEISLVGFAMDREETFDGVSCVAAPVRVSGALTGAVGISGPSSRLIEQRMLEIGSRIVDSLRTLEVTP